MCVICKQGRGRRLKNEIVMMKATADVHAI
jgi:hypothetical protein